LQRTPSGISTDTAASTIRWRILAGSLRRSRWSRDNQAPTKLVGQDDHPQPMILHGLPVHSPARPSACRCHHRHHQAFRQIPDLKSNFHKAERRSSREFGCADASVFMQSVVV
jgi:hypothetical protein